MRKCLFLFLVLLQISGQILAQANSDELVIITNDSVKQTNLTPVYLRHVFSGHIQHWDSGDKIKVFVLAPTEQVHQTFCQQKLKMFSYQLERLWSQLTYSGQGEPPVIVESMGELVESVSTTPGAIGYTYADQLMTNTTIVGEGAK